MNMPQWVIAFSGLVRRAHNRTAHTPQTLQPIVVVLKDRLNFRINRNVCAFKSIDQVRGSARPCEMKKAADVVVLVKEAE
jgi:hypothetical protein